MTQDNWDGGQEVQSNWFKFEKVGDKIKGTLLKKSLKVSTDAAFPDQYVYELRTTEGEVWNVGVSVKKEGAVSRLNKCKVGEIIGVLFESEGEPSKKGFHPTKNLKVFSFGMDASYNELEGGEEVKSEEPSM